MYFIYHFHLSPYFYLCFKLQFNLWIKKLLLLNTTLCLLNRLWSLVSDSFLHNAPNTSDK